VEATCAVLDASGAIGLAKGGCLLNLPRLFPKCLMPPLAVAEVIDPVSREALESALRLWLVVESARTEVYNSAPPLRSVPDRHVVALALTHPGAVIISGDRRLTNAARREGIPVLTAPDTVKLLAEQGIIAAAKPCLDLMTELGFGMRADEYAAVLKALGEPLD